MHPWAARLRHDLVKRLVWPARDRRDAGGTPSSGELLPRLMDEEGRPATVEQVWGGLKEEAPEGLDLAAFEATLIRAEAAARSGEVAGVLALEPAFEALAAAAARLAPGLKGGG